MKMKLAIALFATFAIMSCGETDTTSPVTPEDTTITVDTNITEKDTIIIDPVTGDTTKVTIKDTIVTVEKKPVVEDTTKTTTPKDTTKVDPNPEDTAKVDPKPEDTTNTNPVGDLDIENSPEYKILDSDTVGTGKYAEMVEELGLKLIPSKERVFIMGLEKHYVDDFLDKDAFMYRTNFEAELDAMPAHKVKFTENFYMKKTEVSCQEYVDLMNQYMSSVHDTTFLLSGAGLVSNLSNKSGKRKTIFKDAGPETAYEMDFNAAKRKIEIVGSSSRIAATGISWYGAAFYCNLLSRKYNLEQVYDQETWEADFSKNGFRLATEAEWEYACKGGTDTPFFWGDMDKLGRYNLYVQKSLTSVGLLQSNKFGIQDMVGNAQEWCNDYWSEYSSEDQIDPRGISKADAVDDVSSYNKVLRGGGTNPTGVFYLSAIRSYSPDYSMNDKGIRVVLPIKE